MATLPGMSATTYQNNQVNNGLDPNQAKKPPILPYQTPGSMTPTVQPSTNPFTPDGSSFSFMANNNQQGGQGGIPQINPQNVQGLQSNYTPDQKNQQVLDTAQNKAIQGFQSPVMDQTSQLTGQVLQDPQMGFNPQQQMQRGMEQFDLQRAQGMEAARQALAPVMNTGAARGDFMDLAIQGGQNRAMFESDQERAARDEQRKNIFAALAEGRATGEQERQRFATDIDALAQIRGAAEGQENRNMTVAENAMDRGLQIAMANQDAALQTSLTELKGKIDQGMLLTQQDFQGAQADLDRQLQDAIAKGNWSNAIQLEQLRGDIAIMRDEADRKWQTGERVASQVYNTSERVGAQDFETSIKWLDHEIGQAAADNDVGRQEYLMDKRAMIDLKMQTNSFDHDTKMKYLDSQLAEAAANGDVERQKDVLQFKHTQAIDYLAKEQGYQASRDYIAQQHDLALQSNDITAQKALQAASIEASAREAALDRQHQLNLTDLEQKFAEKGIALQTVLSNLENMDPAQAADAMYQQAQAAGIDIGPNPALLRDIKSIRQDDSLYQTEDQKRAAWIQRANQQGIPMQEAIDLWNYQEENAVNQGFVTETASLIRNGGYKNVGDVDWQSEEGQAVYDALLNDTTIIKGTGRPQVFDKPGILNNYRIFQNLENAYENSEPVNIGGEIYIVTSVSRDKSLGPDESDYQLQNLRTGETIVKRAE